MKSGGVPSSWLGITGNWTAVALLALLAEVDRLGVKHDDLEAVRAIWRRMIASGEIDKAKKQR